MSVRLITDGEHKDLLERIDDMVRKEISTKDSKLASLATMRLAVEGFVRNARELPPRLNDFVNVVNILRSIDLPDLQAAGLFVDVTSGDDRNISRIGSFRLDPVAFLVRADDPTRRAIWTLVERRMRPLMKAAEPNHEHAAP